jgi:hypothetical protein
VKEAWRFIPPIDPRLLYTALRYTVKMTTINLRETEQSDHVHSHLLVHTSGITHKKIYFRE